MPLSSTFSKEIEGYKILNLLGTGGFACVYRARCRRTRMEIAIKMIDKKKIHAKGMEDRVHQEVLIHSRLKHPSVLELYTAFEDSNYVYLVLELCHKGELQSFLNQKGRLSEEVAKRIFKQVVDGLWYLHKHRIVHRDISLKNLLLTMDMQVKIADFGLATQLTRIDEKHLTMCGTPNFISPEVATGSSHGLETDVWSLGCMLYTLLVGKPPFEAGTVKGTLTKLVMDDYIVPSYLSHNARNLLDNLLQKNEKDRIHLRDIVKHPFITALDQREKEKSENISSMDSGLGNTVSSCNNKQRIRSQAEEEICTTSARFDNDVVAVNNKFMSNINTEPLLGIIEESHSLSNTVPVENDIIENSCLSSNSSTLLLEVLSERWLTKCSNKKQMDQQQNARQKGFLYLKKRNKTKITKDIENELQICPLNTRRLQPTRHKTKNAILTILENGDVCIEFIKNKCNVTDRDRKRKLFSSKNVSKVTLGQIYGGHQLSSLLHLLSN